MRKILNVHRNDDPSQYQCFGCSPFNETGLQLEFWEDGDEVISNWLPKEKLMGWVNILHGGIQSTLIDEIAAWVVYVKCMTAGVTAELNVKYLKPVYLTDGEVQIRGELVEKSKRYADIAVSLFSNGELCAEGKVKYFIFPENIAKAKFHYPGIDAFFE